MKPLPRICLKTLLGMCLAAASGGLTPLWAQIQVTSATPNNAAQGTINLNVVIGGSGFKKGATSAWYISGTTNPGGVTVNSTAFNSSSQLTANITVSTTAYTGSFDVVVYSSGRTGKGTGLFTVKTNGNTKISTCTNTSGTNITSNILGTSNPPFQLLSDGLGVYTTTSNTSTGTTLSLVQNSTYDFVLDLCGTTVRSEQLSLEFPASSGAQLPTGWPTDGSLVPINGLVMTNCGRNSANNGVSFGSMTFVGQTIQCGFHITFFVNGVQYSVRMNPASYAGATWAQVTCTGAAANQCNAWTITPIPSGDPGSAVNPYTQQASGIGELVLPSCDGCGGGTPLGLYYVDFSVVATNP